MATLPSDTISASLESALLRFSQMVRRVGARHGLRGADVDDLVQEVRIRLWRAGDSGERIAGLGTSYVYRTAMTAAVDLIRGRRRGMNALLEPESRRSDLVAVRMQRAPDELLEDLELGAAIEAAIEELHVTRRGVVRMFLAGYDRDEIATLLGWTEAKTRNLLYRGLADLRLELTARGIAPGATR